MRLYHFTNVMTDKLIPKMEEYHPLGKNSDIIEKPVIWLSNLPTVKVQREQVAQYRYTIEVPENDPNLGYDKGQQVAAQIFQLISEHEVPIWYYLTRDIDVSETYEWNGTEYVRIPNLNAARTMP